MSEGVVVALCAVLIAVGMIGIVLPVLPGLFLTLLAVFIWAVATGGSTAWTIFGIAALVWAIGVTAQFLIPGKRLKAQGVGMTTMLLAVVGGIIGFFVIPVIGAPVGFVLAILLIELTRTQDLHDRLGSHQAGSHRDRAQHGDRADHGLHHRRAVRRRRAAHLTF